LKFTTASVRVKVGGMANVKFVKATLVVFVQYWPVNPVPFPTAAVLMNEAEATPLLTAPDLTATAWRFKVLTTAKGPE